MLGLWWAASPVAEDRLEGSARWLRGQRHLPQDPIFLKSLPKERHELPLALLLRFQWQTKALLPQIHSEESTRSIRHV